MARMTEEIVKPGVLQIRFTQNTSHGGIEYGPDYETDTAEIDAREATIYVQKGRAHFVVETEANLATALTTATDPTVSAKKKK